MPIVPVTVGNVSDWSHSTIFTTDLTSYQKQNVPALTSVWTPPSGCSNRWMAEELTVVGTVTSVASREANDTIVTPDPAGRTTVASTMRASADQTTIVSTMSTPALLRRATTGPTFLPVSTPETGRTPRTFMDVFVAFSTFPSDTGASTLYDTSYSKCQPFSVPVHFSPGICPNGQTVAEITEYRYSTTSGSIMTIFEASCCQSGMSFGAQFESACISNITEPLRIFEPITTSVNGEDITAYEYVARAFIGSTYGTDGYSTTTFSSISTASAGFVGADPIVIGFQESDLLSFPADYVSSLAKRYTTNWTATATTSAPSTAPTAGSSPNIPTETNRATPSHASELGTGAKAGIGVGVSIAAIGIAVIAALMLLRRRRKSRRPDGEDNRIPEMADRDEVLSSKKWYLFGRWRNELPVENQRQELDPKAIHVVNQIPVELDTPQQPKELGPDPSPHPQEMGPNSPQGPQEIGPNSPQELQGPQGSGLDSVKQRHETEQDANKR